MAQVMRNSDEIPFGARLESLAEKLLALRAEIDATLVELDAHAAVARPTSADPEPVALSDRLAGLGAVAGPEELHGHFASPTSVWVASPDVPDDDETDADIAYQPDLAAIDHADDTVAAGDENVIAELPITIHAAAEPDASEQPSPLASCAESDAPVETAPAANDDLTRIAGIDAGMAGHLNTLGITAYGQLAVWSGEDVTRISHALDLDRRISKENWIEQAAILETGKSTAFATRHSGATPAEAETPPSGSTEYVQEASAPETPAETQVINLDEHRLKSTAAPVSGKHTQPRRRRYFAATLATGLAASMGFAAVMLVDIEDIRARAAASEALRTFFDQTKRRFEVRQPVQEDESRRPAPHITDGATDDFWIRHQQMWAPSP